MTAYLGIDPGLSGALAYINANSIHALPIPVAGKEIDVQSIITWIESKPSVSVACIEKTWGVSKGSIAIARLNYSAGVLAGIISTLGIPLYKVAPVTWKKEILGNYRAKKQDAIEYCQKNYPNISLLRTNKSEVPDHNIADAICLADYARQISKIKV